jgi:tripartite-type tricarboxylate transporter receptor subunit TctC
MKKLLAVVSVLTVLGFTLVALAQKYPSRPINLIVPWSAGGSTDLTARALAPVLDKILGQPVKVENRTGGGGAIGHGAIAQGGPDGYNIGIITLEVVLPAWVNNTKIDANSFTPIALLVLNPVAVVVRKDAPWKTLQDLMADIKANPGKFKSAGTARGGSYDYARAGFLKAIGLKETALPWVPTQGAAAALQELVSGGVNVGFVSIGESSALTKAGEIRQLAFMTDKRFAGFPEVPTLKELGIDWTFASFLMAAAPKHTLPSVARQLDVAFSKAVQDADFVKFMNNANLVINHLNYDKTKAFLAERTKAMAELAEDLK